MICGQMFDTGVCTLGRRQYAEDDADDDWDDEASWDDDLNEDPDEDDNTVPCPHCRRQIHEEAEQCPYCERYISEEDTVTFGKPWWVVVGAVVCLYVMYRSIVGGW